MKLVSYNQGHVGVLTADGVVDVTDLAGVNAEFWPPVGMVKLIDGFDSLRAAIDDAVASRAPLPLSEVDLQAPCGGRIKWSRSRPTTMLISRK